MVESTTMHKLDFTKSSLYFFPFSSSRIPDFSLVYFFIWRYTGILNTFFQSEVRVCLLFLSLLLTIWPSLSRPERRPSLSTEQPEKEVLARPPIAGERSRDGRGNAGPAELSSARNNNARHGRNPSRPGPYVFCGP